jgi:two-component system chemotaxis sensor kinase CheA
MSNGIPENALAEFFAEADEIIQRVTSILSQAESKGLTDDSVDSLYRDIHTLKGSAQLFGFKNIGMISHALEASLEPVRKKKIKITPPLLDHLFKCLDFIDKVIKSPEKDLNDDGATKLQIQKLITQLIAISTEMFNGNQLILNDEQIPQEANAKLNFKLNSDSNSSEIQKSDTTITKPTSPTAIVNPIKKEGERFFICIPVTSYKT